jgi:hypothetical protein
MRLCLPLPLAKRCRWRPMFTRGLPKTQLPAAGFSTAPSLLRCVSFGRGRTGLFALKRLKRSPRPLSNLAPPVAKRPESPTSGGDLPMPGPQPTIAANAETASRTEYTSGLCRMSAVRGDYETSRRRICTRMVLASRWNDRLTRLRRRGWFVTLVPVEWCWTAGVLRSRQRKPRGTGSPESTRRGGRHAN